MKEVRYVLALRKNLISIRALEVKSYNITVEDGTMKFKFRAMVILQGVRHHNLNYLKGGTINEANISNAPPPR